MGGKYEVNVQSSWGQWMQLDKNSYNKSALSDAIKNKQIIPAGGSLALLPV